MKRIRIKHLYDKYTIKQQSEEDRIRMNFYFNIELNQAEHYFKTLMNDYIDIEQEDFMNDIPYLLTHNRKHEHTKTNIIKLNSQYNLNNHIELFNKILIRPEDY